MRKEDKKEDGEGGEGKKIGKEKEKLRRRGKEEERGGKMINIK